MVLFIVEETEWITKDYPWFAFMAARGVRRLFWPDIEPYVAAVRRSAYKYRKAPGNPESFHFDYAGRKEQSFVKQGN
jgi:hypothetical protein